MDIIKWLEAWYQSNCNGYWEHSYGIKIDTLDNPGWCISIDLIDTKEEGKVFSIQIENTDEDWYSIVSEGDVFKAYGDCNKLTFLLLKFKEFVESRSSDINEIDNKEIED